MSVKLLNFENTFPVTIRNQGIQKVKQQLKSISNCNVTNYLEEDYNVLMISWMNTACAPSSQMSKCTPS